MSDIDLVGADTLLNQRLNRLVHDHRLASIEIHEALRGRRVVFRGWMVAGVRRTGTIVSASVQEKSISIGVDVDRLDGRIGFERREGVLADTWYGWINAVELMP